MTSRTPLHEADRIPVPDLWPEVRRRAARAGSGLPQERWSPLPGPWHRVGTAVIALSLFAGAAVTVWSAFLSGPTGRPGRVSVPGPERVSPHVVARIEVPGYAGTIAAGEDAIWVRVSGPGRREKLVRIDSNTNRIVGEITLPPVSFDATLVVGGGAVWAASNDGLVRVDPETNTVATTIPGIIAVYDYGFGSVWAQGENDDGENSIVRIDPLTNQVAAWIPFEDPPEAVVAGEGAVWVNERIADDPETDDGTVVRIDPATNEIVARIDVKSAGYILAAGGGRVWVPAWVGPDTPGVVAIDPATNEPVEDSGSIRWFRPFAVGAGGIWVLSGPQPPQGVCRMDPRSLALGACVDPGPTSSAFPFPADLDTATDTIWVSSDDETVIRIDLTERKDGRPENEN